MRRRSQAGLVVAAVASLAVLLLRAPVAHAESELRPSIDFARILSQGQLLLLRTPTPPALREEDAPDAAERRGPPRAYPIPKMSLVARDWEGAYGIAGESPMVTDAVRPSRSSRVVLGRARLPLRGWAPFVHVGVGLWRPDRQMVPFFRSDTEYATQLGGGAELRIAKRGSVAVECEYTLFYREGREPQYIPSPSVVNVFVALRAEF